MTTPDRDAVRATIEGYLTEAGIEGEPGTRDDEWVVSLPGEHKLKTVCSLLLTEQGLSATAFVIRNPDENHEAVYRWLLTRNLRLPLVGYAVDASGDVYLTGRVPLVAVTPEVLDQLLGVVLQGADGAFNELLALGFLSSMRKEWDWRVSRGESLANLEPFRHLLERPGGPVGE